MIRFGAAWVLGLAAAIAAAPLSAATPVDRFVPKGWVRESQTTGDLDGDRRADTVLIVRQNDPTKKIRNDGLGEQVLDTNPRRLLVLLARERGLKPAVAVDGFIPPRGSPDNSCLADRMAEGGISIKRGILHVAMQNWLSCGSYGVTNRDYALRLDNGRLRLIGFERLDFSRSSGEGERLSANFLSGRYSKTTGLVIVGEQAAHPRTSWRRFGAKPIYADAISPDECLTVETLAGFC